MRYERNEREEPASCDHLPKCPYQATVQGLVEMPEKHQFPANFISQQPRLTIGY